MLLAALRPETTHFEQSKFFEEPVHYTVTILLNRTTVERIDDLYSSYLPRQNAAYRFR